jgi:hypothetical protein
MSTEWVRRFCMKLPHTTEEVLWGGDLVFKIGGKMYAVTVLEPGPLCPMPHSFREVGLSTSGGADPLVRGGTPSSRSCPR